MLNPGNNSTLNTNKLDREEIMGYVREHNLFKNVVLFNNSYVINQKEIMAVDLNKKTATQSQEKKATKIANESNFKKKAKML